MSLDWPKIIEWVIKGAVAWTAIKIVKKGKPFVILVRKYFNVLVRVEETSNKVDIEISRRWAEYHTDLNPILIKNREGEVKYVNPAFVDMTGISNVQEALGFGYVDTIHPMDEVRAERDRELQIRRPSEMSGKIHFKHKEKGHTILCFYRTQLVKNSKKEVIEILVRLYIIA